MFIRNKYRKLIKTLIVISIFLTGIFFGALLHILWVFPFPQLSAFKLSYIAKKEKKNRKLTVHKKSGKYLHIPVEFLPNYKIENDSMDQPFLKNEIGKAELITHVKEVALVLVDTWETTKDSIKPDLIRLNQMRILDFCRNNEITIIHAPNHPVVQKYNQYHKLKNHVNKIIESNDFFNSNLPFFMEWPSINNSIWKKAQDIRYSGRVALYSFHPTKERDISRYLKPLKNEYVLNNYMEFRYVLWKERIKLLLYLGGALNECMQHRDTGINILAGTDSRRTPFTIVILEDCSTAMGSPEISSKMAAKVMLDYFKFKIAFTTNSKQLRVYVNESE
jgi:hypothetical protein